MGGLWGGAKPTDASKGSGKKSDPVVEPTVEDPDVTDPTTTDPQPKPLGETHGV